jgi:hypothetical protein
MWHQMVDAELPTLHIAVFSSLWMKLNFGRMLVFFDMLTGSCYRKVGRRRSKAGMAMLGRLM